MGRTTARLKIKNAYDVQKAAEGLIPESKVRTVKVEAVVDTGATYVCLSRADIQTLGLPFHRKVEIRTANGRASRRTFKGAEIEMSGRSFVMEVMENDEDTPALVGYLLLEALDFVVDLKTRQVMPNPAHDGKWVADLY
ncbi:MAG: aspartyl protease [Planctomycetes bacterium]|nr:aspartyl protease [Planctomycetota bacterium]MBM4079755.1 aspartyl protease [Planctomycetota bacterium]